MNAPKSALATFGIKKWPQGTPDDLQSMGLDPKRVPSCAAPGPGVQGCPYWTQCRFGLDSMGAFKGNGPRYIAYRQVNPDEGDAAQDIATCFQYTHQLQPKSDAGAALRRTTNGQRGSVIRVIAQEGQEFIQEFDFPINARGEVVNVMPELIPTLEANEIKFSTMAREESVGRKRFELKRIVPTFPRLGHREAGSFAEKVAMWDMPEDAKDRGEKVKVMPEMAQPVGKQKLAEKA